MPKIKNNNYDETKRQNIPKIKCLKNVKKKPMSKAKES
jgi:hypothetical protein